MLEGEGDLRGERGTLQGGSIKVGRGFNTHTRQPESSVESRNAFILVYLRDSVGDSAVSFLLTLNLYLCFNKRQWVQCTSNWKMEDKQKISM